jgi:hypothetical protein
VYRRKVEVPKSETADFIGALKSPFVSVSMGCRDGIIGDTRAA